MVRYRERAELEAGLGDIEASPTDIGVLELVIRRPAVGERDILESAELSTDVGVVGDNWIERSSKRTPDGSPHPDMQLNIINSRLARLVAGDDPADRALAGDQLHVDLDLSFDNLPTGTRLAIGDAVVEVTDQPHTGCPKFAGRFGKQALQFATTGRGGELRLRGINAKVVTSGRVRPGDKVAKL